MLPKYKNQLKVLGENFKLARLRRKLTEEQICERANISDYILYEIEQGNGAISIVDYYKVLIALNLSDDILKLAGDDILGRKLQDIELLKK